MTREQKKISIKNHKKAVKYFESIYPWFKNRKPKEYVLHHINPSWKTEDIERYIQWNIEDLVIMTRAEHLKLHSVYIDQSYKHNPRSEETKKKISKTTTGHIGYNKGDNLNSEQKKTISDGTKKGIANMSDEAKKQKQDKINAAKEGYVWYTNGIKNTMTNICPDGWWRGRTNKKGIA